MVPAGPGQEEIVRMLLRKGAMVNTSTGSKIGRWSVLRKLRQRAGGWLSELHDLVSAGGVEG
jgi:hypothetical protein